MSAFTVNKTAEPLYSQGIIIWGAGGGGGGGEKEEKDQR